MEEMKTVRITFDSVEDFRNRIQGLWADQPEDVRYDFVFPNQKTEDEFNLLVKKYDCETCDG